MVIGQDVDANRAEAAHVAQVAATSEQPELEALGKRVHKEVKQTDLHGVDLIADILQVVKALTGPLPAALRCRAAFREGRQQRQIGMNLGHLRGQRHDRPARKANLLGKPLGLFLQDLGIVRELNFGQTVVSMGLAGQRAQATHVQQRWICRYVGALRVFQWLPLGVVGVALTVAEVLVGLAGAARGDL